MPWPIELHQHVAVVNMTSPFPVVVQDEAFIAELNATFDRLEADHPRSPVVLTSSGKSFCAGLNFEAAWALFASKDLARIEAFFTVYRAMNLRVFRHPRPTVAAINGHAYAGGLILALACDARICAADARLALNEVPIGIPMPAAYVEIIRYAVGVSAGSMLTLFGREIDAAEALRVGVVHASVAKEQVLAEAVRLAASIHPDTLAGYAFSKHALQQPTLERIATSAAALDADLVRILSDPEAVRARVRRYTEIKRKPPSWA